jgi:hypothetical protein
MLQNPPNQPKDWSPLTNVLYETFQNVQRENAWLGILAGQICAE